MTEPRVGGLKRTLATLVLAAAVGAVLPLASSASSTAPGAWMPGRARALAQDSWSMLGHDAAHTGRSGYVGPSVPHEKWQSFAAYDDIKASPAVGADGTIYLVARFSRSVCKLYALHPNGNKKWELAVPGADNFGSAAVGTDGTVYVSGGDRLYAANPSGVQKWVRVGVAGESLSSPMIGPDGTVYASDRGGLHAWTPGGTHRWYFNPGGYFHSGIGLPSPVPAIGADGTIYIIGEVGRRLYALHSSGTTKWQFDINGCGGVPTVAPDGTVYLSCGDSFVAVRTDGSKKWQLATTGGSFSNPAIGRDGTIYCGDRGGTLHAIDSGGTWRWQLAITSGSNSFSNLAIDADDTIYFGSLDNRLYAVSSSGAKKWEFGMAHMVVYSPVIGAAGTLYVGTGDNRLYAIGSATGTRTPHVLSRPVPSATSVKAGAAVKVTGTLRPAHAARTPVTVRAYKTDSTGRLLGRPVPFTGRVVSGTLWSASVRLPSRGSWRFVAYKAADSAHVAATSAASERRVAAWGPPHVLSRAVPAVYSVKRGTSFKITGTLSPAHPKGTLVRVWASRSVGRRPVGRRLVFTGRVISTSNGQSKWVSTVRISTAGYWGFAAYKDADPLHAYGKATAWSARNVRVR